MCFPSCFHRCSGGIYELDYGDVYNYQSLKVNYFLKIHNTGDATVYIMSYGKKKIVSDSEYPISLLIWKICRATLYIYEKLEYGI